MLVVLKVDSKESNGDQGTVYFRDTSPLNQYPEDGVRRVDTPKGVQEEEGEPEEVEDADEIDEADEVEEDKLGTV